VAAGGRTGLTALVTAGLFLATLFVSPLVKMIGGGYAAAPGGPMLYPVVAPPLIIVGAMIIGTVRDIDWKDPTEGIPAFLTMVMMPLAVSITEGVAFGVVAYTVLKTVAGRGRQVHPLLYVFAVLFVLRYAFLRG
jgi:AGZA family xanthine/uracil permease-like MFS transporter